MTKTNIFRCDWCNKQFEYPAPLFNHICPVNQEDVGIGVLEGGLPVPPTQRIITLAPINRFLLPNEP